MIIQKLPDRLSVCKVQSVTDIDIQAEFYFVGRTDEEVSLVCRTEEVPAKATDRSDGWRAFRIQGPLDFGLIGILSRISTILAEKRIGIFAVSTYNTDYILVKEEDYDRALTALEQEGYTIS